MKLLAIETATEACSAALLYDAEISLRYQVKPQGHSELILAMMDELLTEAGIGIGQLDALAFGRGPGSFTGVRIATGVIQGVAFGAGLPVVPVSTLAALAQQAYRRYGATRLLPAYDARMGELYWAAYQVDRKGVVELLGQEQVADAEQVQIPEGQGWFGVGSGWLAHGDLLGQRLNGRAECGDPQMLCSAHDVAGLGAVGFERGEAVSAERALPIYLRDNVAKRPGA